jgi:threonine/homoserine/homoserine lactone efflux protein
MSGLQPVLALLLVSLAVMGSPGPATISVTAVGSAFGWRRSLPYVAGVIVGTAAVLLLVATGLTAVLLSLPAIGPFLLVASCAYILVLAWRIATAPPLAAHDVDAPAPSPAGGFLLGIGNPKAWIAIAAVFASGRLATSPFTDALAKVALLAAMIVVIHLAWLAVGLSLARILRHPVGSRIVNGILAVALVASTAIALLPG